MSTKVGIPVEEFVEQSRHLTGKSRAISSKIFPPQPIRPNRGIIIPVRDFGLRARKVATAELLNALREEGLAPANLSELLQYVADGQWDGHTKTGALGQIGEESFNGRTSRYVPALWSAGAIHHVRACSLSEAWDASDHFLVIKP